VLEVDYGGTKGALVLQVDFGELRGISVRSRLWGTKGH